METIEQSFTSTIHKKLGLEFLLNLPPNYDNQQKWPLLVFLHGTGERGAGLKLLKESWWIKLVEEKKLPFIVLSPQCPENSWWNSETLDALIQHTIENYKVDQQRIYLTGLSMGGYGTWSLAIDYPQRFAAIAPICGVGNPFFADKIKHIPTWVFHGAKDEVIDIRNSYEMVKAVEDAGGNIKFTIYPEAEHDSWTETYNNSLLFEWFLKFSKL